MKRIRVNPATGNTCNYSSFIYPIVTAATRKHDSCDGFHAMNGYTIAQTVAMKIHGAHLASNRKTRQHADSIYSAY